MTGVPSLLNQKYRAIFRMGSARLRVRGAGAHASPFGIQAARTRALPGFLQEINDSGGWSIPNNYVADGVL